MGHRPAENNLDSTIIHCKPENLPHHPPPLEQVGWTRVGPVLLLTEKEGVTRESPGDCKADKLREPEDVCTSSTGKEQGSCHSFVNNNGIFLLLFLE